MKQQETLPANFIETVRRLENSPLNAINVVDRDTTKNIACNANIDYFIEKYGGITEFFESIKAQGVTSVRIIGRRKNGSNFRPTGEEYNFEFDGGNSETPVHSAPVVAEIMPMPMALNSPMQGLNSVQFYNAMDYDRVKRELDKTLLELKVEKDENYRLKEEALKNEYSEKKAQGNNDLLLGIIPHLAPILTQKLGGGSAAAPMVEAIGMTGATETHAAAVAILNTLDENTAYDLALIMRNLSGNESLQSEVVELVKKYNLEPAHHDN